MNQLLKNQKLRIRIDTKLLARVKKVRGLTLSDKVRRTLIAGLDKKPIDNNDYVDVLASIFEFRQTLSPVGSNLNQLTRLLNSEPHLFQEVKNINTLDELKPLLKESIKIPNPKIEPPTIKNHTKHLKKSPHSIFATHKTQTFF